MSSGDESLLTNAASTWEYLYFKVHGAYMGPIWVLSAPYGSYEGPMNLAIRDNYSVGIGKDDDSL